MIIPTLVWDKQGSVPVFKSSINVQATVKAVGSLRIMANLNWCQKQASQIPCISEFHVLIL